MSNQQPTITITTATELSADQKKEAKALVISRAGSAIVEFQIDPVVLGGIKVTVGGQTFDATLEGQLKRLSLGNETCRVITAVPLTKQQRETITLAIREKYGSVALQEVIDPAVIGGIKVIVGSKEYDRTVAGKLTKLKAHSLAKV